jgi:iron complex transport system permease protein
MCRGLYFFEQRLPRVIGAILVGGGLAVAGCSLQILFRNPLAEPWTLGISGGASVGAFIAYAFPSIAMRSGLLDSTALMALLGAAAVLALLLWCAHGRDAVPVQTLLLGGVTISVLTSGLMMLSVYFISPYRFFSFHRWMMGGLDLAGFRGLLPFLFTGVPGLFLLLQLARAYNHLGLGEALALGHGVDVVRVRWQTLLGAGLLTAGCVSVAGPIGFLGLIIPHAVRKLSGFDNRIVMPASFLLGGVVLAAADSAARTVLSPTEIPVGVIMAVIGGPVFLYLLLKRRSPR